MHGGLEVLQTQRVHGGALVGIQGVELPENFSLFTSGGQIDSLK